MSRPFDLFGFKRFGSQFFSLKVPKGVLVFLGPTEGPLGKLAIF